MLTYDLAKRYSQFRATVGVDDEVGPKGSVVFKVVGDGKTLYKSKVLKGAQKGLPIEVNVSGVSKLALETDFADDGGWGDHGDWADVRLVRESRR